MTTSTPGEVLTDRALAALQAAFADTPLVADAAGLLVISVGAGALVCDVDDAATTAWVVVSGRLEASAIELDGSERIIGVLGPGELVGEAALLEGGQRRARVRAQRPSELVELDRAWLIGLLSDEPGAAMNVVRTLIERSDRPLARPAGVVAIVPLDSTVVDEARAVGEAATTIGDRVLIGGDDIPTRAPSTNGVDLAWLDEAERTHDAVVLFGHPTDAAWTATAAELADRVLFVVDAERGPEIGEFEHQVLRAIPRQANATRMLLLVHPADTDQPSGTRAWLDRRELDRHVHLRRHEPRHRTRVARHLIGRPLTLAIGAGGVRSAGAVGTVRALATRGVSIDAVSGVSGGAIIAGWLAISTTIDELENKTEWSMHKLLDYTLPVGSVIAGKRAWSRIQEAVGDLDIADSWIPLSIVSTDLTEGEPVNHIRGPMADALYASISIPGVFPPVDIDGHLHVDGAVFDAIPVEAARLLVPEGELVTVDLAPPTGKDTAPVPRVMKGGGILFRRLVPGLRAPSVPNPLDTLMRTTTVASAHRRLDALEAVNCHVHLDLSEYGVLEFDKVRRIITLGEAQSAETIDGYLGGDHPPLADPALADAAAGSAPITPTPSGSDERSSSAAIAGSLALAWADLRFRARRFAVAGLASSVVLALLLQMTGVVNQLYREPNVTVDAFGGSHWLLPADADGAFTSNATITASAVDEIEGGRVLLARFRLADEDWGDDLDAILVGHVELPDGAPDLDEGQPAIGAGEVVLSDAAGHSVGDIVLVGASPMVVTGTVSGATVFAGMPLVFVPLDVARDLIVGGEPLLSALVVGDLPADLPAGLHALDAGAVAEDALGPVERPITTLRLVQILLAVVAALIIGAVVFLATIDRLRDIAVMRAIGVRSNVIGLGVAAQALGIGLVSGLAALVIQRLLAPLFPLHVHLQTVDRVLLVVVAMAVAAVASYGAIRRTLRIDPAQAFAGPGA